MSKKTKVELLKRSDVLAAIPTNWVDSLLTGPNAAIGNQPYGCPDIEALLRAVKARLEKLAIQ